MRCARDVIDRSREGLLSFLSSTDGWMDRSCRFFTASMTTTWGYGDDDGGVRTPGRSIGSTTRGLDGESDDRSIDRMNGFSTTRGLVLDHIFIRESMAF